MSLSLLEPLRRHYRVVFFGSDSFSLPHLKTLWGTIGKPNACVSELAVVCPESHGHTGALPVEKFSKDKDLPLHLTDKEWGNPFFQNHGFDIGVVASFGLKIPTSVIASFPHGIINVHPSLLPRYRGAAPMYHTILNGDPSTAVTIMEVSPKFDQGHILNVAHFDIPSGSAYPEFVKMVLEVSCPLLLDTLSNIEQFKAKKIPQSSTGILPSKAPKITKSQTQVIWEKHSKKEIYNMFRAFDSSFRIFTNFEGKHLVLSSLIDENEPLPIVDTYSNLHRHQDSTHNTSGGESKLSSEEEILKASPFGLLLFNARANILLVRAKDAFVGVKSVTFPKKGKTDAASFVNGYGVRKARDRCFSDLPSPSE